MRPSVEAWTSISLYERALRMAIAARLARELHVLHLALLERAPGQAIDGQQADHRAHEAQGHEHGGLRLEV